MMQKSEENQPKLLEKSTTLVNLRKEFYSSDNWYSKNNQIKVDETGTMIFESADDTAKYYSFFEKNSSFQRLTDKSKKIRLSLNNTFEFTGRVTSGVEVIIYFIEYTADLKRTKTNRIPLNKRTTIVKKNASVFGRLAVRMEGAGSLYIYELRTFPFKPASFKNDEKGQDSFVKNKNIACILDNRSKKGLSSEANLLSFSTHNWEKVLLTNKPEFLLVESAWKGNNGAWYKEIEVNDENQESYHLNKLLLWCNLNNIPTVFWNTEDPDHFETFKQSAAMFDYIFTIDMDNMPAYRSLTEDAYIGYLPLAALSTMYHPDSLLHLNQQQEDISEGSEPERKVVSIDSLQSNCDEFSQATIYKEAFDAIAQGKPVAGGDLPLLKKAFHGVAVLIDDEQARKKEIAALENDSNRYDYYSRKSVREIFRKHLYHHRIHKIVESLNIPFRPLRDDITLLFIIDSEENFNIAMEIVDAQTYQEKKVLMIFKPFEGYESIFNTYNDEDTAIAIHDSVYNRKVSDMIFSKFITVMHIDRIYHPCFTEDAVYAGVAASAMIVQNNEDIVLAKEPIFNTASIATWEIGDVVKKSDKVMEVVAEEKQSLWKTAGMYHLLLSN